MARLLSRAYEGLNRILSLAGNTSISDIDIDSAFAIHSLNSIVQAQAIREYIYVLEDNAGAGNVALQSSFFDITDWDAVYVSTYGDAGRQVTTDDELPSRVTDDLWLTDVAFSSDTTNLGNVAGFVRNAAIGVSGATLMPVTALLTQAEQLPGGVVAWGSNGEPYYMISMPHRLWGASGAGTEEQFAARISYSGAAVVDVQVHVMVAVSGVLPAMGFGT